MIYKKFQISSQCKIRLTLDCLHGLLLIGTRHDGSLGKVDLGTKTAYNTSKNVTSCSATFRGAFASAAPEALFSRGSHIPLSHLIMHDDSPLLLSYLSSFALSSSRTSNGWNAYLKRRGGRLQSRGRSPTFSRGLRLRALGPRGTTTAVSPA